jgi:putative flippase GtrA
MNGIPLSRFIKYITVGVIGLTINECLLILLHGVLGLWLTAAALVAGETGIICQFVLNDSWSFKTVTTVLPRWKRFISYQSVSIVAVVINTVVLNLLVIFAGIDYKVANVMAVFVGFIWNVCMNFMVTWKHA